MSGKVRAKTPDSYQGSRRFKGRDTCSRHLRVGHVTSIPGRIALSFATLVLLIGLSSHWMYSNFSTAILAAIVGLYFILSAFRLTACLTPRPKDSQIGLTMDWPPYTLLIPLYQESHMIDSLMTHLSRLDYPQQKLQILIICEADDLATIAATTPYIGGSVALILVAKSQIRTKPHALNKALKFATGDIITIYDAEDRPHKAQLKTAASAFHLHPDWAALQAPLRFYNAKKNMLTRQFALEYSALFYVWVPGLARIGCPFPLGGTSNHIRRSLLEDIGGWDSRNVTEDADLSFRIAMMNGTIGYISTPTYEETVEGLTSWHNQRSRWMKGFMQTYNLHMHAPFSPSGWAGFTRLLTLHLTLGAALMSGLFHLPFVVMTLTSILAFNRHLAFPYIPDWFAYSLCVGYGISMLCGVVGAVRSRQAYLIADVVIMPAYWLMLFVPTITALIELKTRPFYWNKTRHGVTDAL